MSKTFKCHHCGKRHPINPRIKNKQKYCGSSSCQQARKNKWEREKIKKDSTYRQKRQSSKRMWRKTRPLYEYQRQYRLTHPEYVRINCEQQKLRNTRRNESVCRGQIVKTDALNCRMPDIHGLYALIPYHISMQQKIVKTDALIVQLTNIQSNTAHFLNNSS